MSPSADMPKKCECLPSHSPASGLIFGTSCKDTLRHDLVKRDHLQSHCKRLSWDSSAYKPWKWSIFGTSSQHDRASVLSPISCGTTLKQQLGRSEMRETNLSNEILDHRKNGLTKSSGLAENRKNEIYLLSAIDASNKFNVKKMVSRGRPAADWCFLSVLFLFSAVCFFGVIWCCFKCSKGAVVRAAFVSFCYSIVFSCLSELVLCCCLLMKLTLFSCHHFTANIHNYMKICCENSKCNFWSSCLLCNMVLLWIL